MNGQQTSGLDDWDAMTDLLSAQKYLTGVYNTICCETATATIRRSLDALLQDEHRIQEELFDTMHARGWYPVEKAEDAMLQAAKQRFAKQVTV